MAKRSLLAMLRGADGRSIGRALALLVLVNALLAGLHTGALAAAGPETSVVCGLAQSVPGDDGSPAAPERDLPCCVAGCTMAAPALAPVADALTPPTFALIGRATVAARSLPAPLPGLVHGARGPPLA